MSFFIIPIIIILFLLLFAVILVFSAIGRVMSFLGFGKRKHFTSSGSSGRRTYTGGSWGGNETSQSNKASTSGWHYSPEAEHKRRKRKKVFQPDEGEYVDFEEVKR